MATVNYPLHIMCALFNRRAYTLQKDIYFKKYKDTNIIAFRGTYDMRSLSYSFDVRSHDKKLHKGYSKYAEHCKQLLKEMDIDYSKKTYITGHSLGSLASVLVANDMNLNAELILFGSPRLATCDFCEEISNNNNLNIYNYINEYDIIADYPFFLYEHIKKPIILKNSQSFMNPINYHSMRTYGHNLVNLKRKVEECKLYDPNDDCIDIM